MEELSPYEQSCIYLSFAVVDHFESKYDDARKHFEKGQRKKFKTLRRAN